MFAARAAMFVRRFRRDPRILYDFIRAGVQSGRLCSLEGHPAASLQLHSHVYVELHGHVCEPHEYGPHREVPAARQATSGREVQGEAQTKRIT